MFLPPHSQFWLFFSEIFLMVHLCLLLLLLRNFRRNIWNAVGTKMRDIWESRLSLLSLGKATTEQYIFPMGSSHFFLHFFFLVPLFEVSIQDSVGESFSANSDALQYTITAQLMHDQRVLHRPRSLWLIGDDAPYKVRMSWSQVCH